MRLPSIVALGLLLATLLVGCAEPPQQAAQGPVTRDSAGVRITENLAPAWANGSGWRLGEAPLLDIGRLDGPDDVRLWSRPH